MKWGSFMAEKDQLQQEEVILEYYYRPFGQMKVTETHLIFKSFWPGINTVKGSINILDIVEVKYLKGIPKIGAPGLEIVYRSPGNLIDRIRIRFPDIVGRLRMEMVSGVTPNEVFETISSLTENAKER